MVNIITFIAATAGLIATAQAGCYTSGRNFDDKGEAYWHAQRACFGYDDGNGYKNGAFTWTWFKPYWDSPYPARVCVNGGGNYQYVFEITNLKNTVGEHLNPQTCYDGLYAEIHGCDKGGSSDKNGWRFKSDPNDGKC